MQKLVCATALLLSFACAGTASAQNYPILDKIADKVVAKYQSSSCAQLEAERAQPKTKDAAEQRVIEMLRADAQMRKEFLDRVAAPVANKLFECGLIP